MKLAIISESSTLKQLDLSGHNVIEEIQFLNETDQIDAFDLIIVSDSVMDVYEAQELKASHPRKIIYFHVESILEPNQLEKITYYCKTHEMTCIPPYFKEKEIEEMILDQVYPSQSVQKDIKKIVVMSTHPAAGGTSITHAIADILSSQSDKVVRVLHLNPYNEGLHEKYEGRSLDEIYISLKNNSLSQEQLSSYFSKVNNFFVLQGNRNLKRIRKFDIKVIEKLIHMTSSMSDIVLMDIGSYIENPLSVQGLLSGDHFFLVATQEEKSRRQFKKNYQQILQGYGIEPENFHLIVNKVREEFADSPRMVSSKVGVPLLIDVPYIQGQSLLELVDTQEKFLSHLDMSKNSIIKIANGITDLHGGNPIQHNKPFWRKILQLR